MNFHRMRLPVGEIAVSSGMAGSRWVLWLVICTVTRSPSTGIEWVCLCASQAGGDGAPDLLPALAPLGAGGMVRHLRADQMIEAVVVLGVEVFTRGFDDGTRFLRHNAHPVPLPGCICKAVRTGKGMEGRTRARVLLIRFAGGVLTPVDWRACASCLVAGRCSGFRMATAAFGEAG